MPSRPLLDDVELPQVQDIATSEDEVLAEHAVPALEGNFLQRLGRRAAGISLQGILSGAEAKADLEKLREKFRLAAPVSFVADIVTAHKVDKVLIETLGIRELAGKPERFEYAFRLREFLPPPQVGTEEPPPPQPQPQPRETATLEIEVIVEGDPNFDFSTVTVTVEGTQRQDGAHLSRTLTNRDNNVWTEEDFPPGDYTVRAVVATPPPAPGTASASVPDQGLERVTILLRRDQATNIAVSFMIHFWFDKAFIEPCMRMVMKEAAKYADTHPDEKLLILGHTDESGSDDYNQALSERRARSAYAYLTFGRDRTAALAEWDQLRRTRPTGVERSINDSWDVRQYEAMLEDLGYYPGNVNDDDTSLTDSAIRAFQGDHGLVVDGIVGDATWPKLI